MESAQQFTCFRLVDCDLSVERAGETEFIIWWDGQCIAAHVVSDWLPYNAPSGQTVADYCVVIVCCDDKVVWRLLDELYIVDSRWISTDDFDRLCFPRVPNHDFLYISWSIFFIQTSIGNEFGKQQTNLTLSIPPVTMRLSSDWMPVIPPTCSLQLAITLCLVKSHNLRLHSPDSPASSCKHVGKWMLLTEWSCSRVCSGCTSMLW